MDYKHSTLALGLLLGATVIGAGWYISRLERRVSAVESEARTPPSVDTALPTFTTTASTPTAPPAPAATGAESAIVAPDSFDRAYRAAGLVATAERECWATANVAPDAFVHFDIRVGADGQVKDAKAVPVRGPSSDEKLMACLKKLVLQLKFPAAPEERSSRVQVSRK